MYKYFHLLKYSKHLKKYLKSVQIYDFLFKKQSKNKSKILKNFLLLVEKFRKVGLNFLFVVCIITVLFFLHK